MSIKISDLPTATTFSGTDLAPIVQGGETKRIAANASWTVGDLAYTGTLTGGTGVVNLGSGQVVKDASGNVGIGTSSPSSALTISRAISPGEYGAQIPMIDFKSFFPPTFDVNTVKARISAGVSSVPTLRTDNGYLSFWTSAANVLSERVRIETNGNVGIGTTSPAKRLDVNGEIRASTGILFGTDTAAANTLDDYEEGTWTPELRVNNSSSGITYDSRAGKYIKIGNVVFLRCTIVLTNKGAGSGNVDVRGIPFAANGTLNNAADLIDNFSSLQAGGAMIVSAGTPFGQNGLFIFEQTSTGRGILQSSKLSNTSNFALSVVYYT